MAKPSSSLCQSISGSLQQEAAGSSRRRQGMEKRAEHETSHCLSADPLRQEDGRPWRIKPGKTLKNHFYNLSWLRKCEGAHTGQQTVTDFTPLFSSVWGVRSNVTLCNFLLRCFAVLSFVVLLPWVSSSYDFLNHQIIEPLLTLLAKGKSDWTMLLYSVS